jgi:DNA-binding protein Fis
MRLNNSSFILPDNGIDLIKLENDLLIQAFRKSNGNYSHAAKLLGVSRFVFRYRLNKLFENNINLIK